MGMFGRSNEVVFDRGRHARRGRTPAWLLALGTGLAIGAIGLVWIQDTFGPPRLSPAQAQQVVTERDEARNARDIAERREREIREALQARLDRSLAEQASIRQALEQRARASADVDETIANLRRDVALFESVIPPDPRDNPIGVRAARLERDNGSLAYHVLLSRQAPPDQPFDGVMQFVVTGQRAGGKTETVTLPAMPVRIGNYRHFTGRQELPKGFDPRRTSIQVFDKVAGNNVGLRVINLQ
ncbi:MAG: DUF6776 family protein [Burkholderiaceae bacterium]